MIRPLATLALALAVLLLRTDAARADEALDLVAVSLEADRLSEASFTAMLAREQRMIEISNRLRRAGVDICGEEVAPILGLQVLRALELPWAYVNPAIRLFGVGVDESIAWIAPGSAAERAGLAPRDVIRSVDGSAITSEVDLNDRRAAPGASSLRFGIERAGARRTLEVPYDPGCSVQPMLGLSSENNALSTEHHVIVFSETMRDAGSDDEIAAVVGHELGHVVLGHRKARAASEAEADYFALYLLARAGFDPEAAAEAWRRRARTMPESLIGWGTHPSAPERALAAEHALAEIAAKRAAGKPLVPEDNQ